MIKRLFPLLLLSVLLAPPAAAQTPSAEARRLLAEGDAAGAAALLEAVPDEERSPADRYVLGLAYQDLMRHDAAVQVLARADSLDARVQAALGRSLDQQGQHREALMRFRRAHALDSTHVGIALSLARLLSEAERWGEVRSIYRRLVDADPENSLLHAQLGGAYLALDSLDAAIVAYEQAHRLNPRNARVALQLSKVYIGAEHLISARRVMERSLEVNPDHPRLWQRRGDVALREGDYSLATEAYRNAIAFGDSNAVNHHNLGVSFYLRGLFDEALPALQTAAVLDTAHVMNQFYLGVTLQQLGRFEEALAALHKTTELAGQAMLGEVHIQIAATHDLMGKPPAAIDSYRLARALAPKKHEVVFQLAKLYDAYYADSSTALRQYEQFLAQIGEAELPDLRAYAEQRVAQLREAGFFQGGRRPAAGAPGDSTAGQ